MTIKFFWVALGGALGSMARYGVGVLLARPHQAWPWGTWVANALASFVLGVFMAWAQRQPTLHETSRLFVAVGFCGGFSTFSTFSAEVWKFLHQQAYSLAFVYSAASLAVTLTTLVFGLWLGSRLG